MAHNRVAKKARAKNDVFDPDYVIKPSPFIINDVTSRAAQLGITPQTKGAHYWDKRNPNEVRKRGTKKKWGQETECFKMMNVYEYCLTM